MPGPLEILAGWVLLATLVALWAGRRGRSAELWFLAAVLTSPLIAWLCLLAIGPGSGAAPLVAADDDDLVDSSAPDDVEFTLGRLATLADQGLITDDEYKDKRREVLGRL